MKDRDIFLAHMWQKVDSLEFEERQKQLVKQRNKLFFWRMFLLYLCFFVGLLAVIVIVVFYSVAYLLFVVLMIFMIVAYCIDGAIGRKKE